MKKIFLVLFVVFQFSFFAFAHDFHLSVEPVAGVKKGQLDELVFLKYPLYSSDKISELNWEMKPSFYLGGKISGGFKKIFAEALVTGALHKKTGSMFDSDWFNANISDAEKYQYKTCFSAHDNYLESDISFGVKAGYDFEIFKNSKLNFTLAPFAGYDYNKIKFSARDGFGLYGYGKDGRFRRENGYYAYYADEDSQQVTKCSGEAVTYERQTSIVWLGLDAKLKLFKKISVNVGAQVSPYIFCESIDTHIARGLMFGDVTPGFFSAFKLNFGTSYTIAKRHSVCLNMSFYKTRTLRGDDYEKGVEESAYKINTAADGGAAQNYFDLSLSYRFKIF